MILSIMEDGITSTITAAGIALLITGGRGCLCRITGFLFKSEDIAGKIFAGIVISSIAGLTVGLTSISGTTTTSAERMISNIVQLSSVRHPFSKTG